VAEELSDFPAAFAKADPMPWDLDQPEVVCWPFGERAGTPLQEFSSNALLRMRGEVERKNGKGNYFAPLIAAIDAVLTERQGE